MGYKKKNDDLKPGPIDPKTGKPKYWYEDLRGKGNPKYASKNKKMKINT